MSDNLPAVGRETLRQLINDNCIYRVPPGSKELPWMEGNGHYGWQFYLRKAVLDPKAIQLIAADFWRRYAPYFKANPFQVAGVEAAAVPILTAIIWHGFERFGFEVNGFTIRKERKKYGLQNLIEGIPSSEPVLFVDDLTSPAHNAFWHFVTKPRSGAVYNIGGGRHANCSVVEAIALCERLTSRPFKWTYEDSNRVGDHIWWISDVRKFMTDYPEWNYRYNLESTLAEIIAGLSDRLAPREHLDVA